MQETVEIVSTYNPGEMKRGPMLPAVCADFLSLCPLHHKPGELPIFAVLVCKPLRYSSDVWLSEILVRFSHVVEASREP